VTTPAEAKLPGGDPSVMFWALLGYAFAMMTTDAEALAERFAIASGVAVNATSRSAVMKRVMRIIWCSPLHEGYGTTGGLKGLAGCGTDRGVPDCCISLSGGFADARVARRARHASFENSGSAGRTRLPYTRSSAMTKAIDRKLSVIGLLSLGLLATSCKGDMGAPGPPGAAGTPAAQGLAAVDASGALIRGLNVASVSRLSQGRYTVTFTSNVNVAVGYYLVTPGLTGTCNMVSEAEQTTGNAVYVSFVDHRTGPGTVTLVDCAFSLVVF